MSIIKGNSKDNSYVGDSDVFGTTNYMYGYGGNDTLEGGFFADNYIWGGVGNDIIRGGTGINRLYGEDGNDTISVFWNAPDSQLYGGAGSDILYAGDGGNYLNGGTGVDFMFGGAGGDVFIVDNAKDIVEDTWVPDFENQANPIDTVRASASFALSSAARIEVIETTAAAGTKAINLTGNGFSQTITGNAGANRLDGLGGNDTLVGGAGADALLGGTGNDTASYAGATKGVVASLGSPAKNTNDAKGDTYTSVENLTGSSFADTLKGDSLANKISGGAGNDKLYGGLGMDVLAGGAGGDTFVFDTKLGSTNVDTIKDFNVVQDTIWLDDDIFTKAGAIGDLTANAFYMGSKAHDASDRVIYDKTSGKLWYDDDGTGGHAAVQFAVIGKGFTLTATDFDIIG
jgi:Ca2+-binding RTX toxin-like protein